MLSSTAILAFQNVSFGYTNSADIIMKGTFSVAGGGDRLFLVGPSGTGKSTVMKLALRLLHPTTGVVDNHSVRPIPIMQNFAASLLPWLSVRKNLLFGNSTLGKALFQPIVSLFEIETLLELRPMQLSGGQIQRVLFARALYQHPDLLIVDEPLSNLDLALSHRILERLKGFLGDHQVSTFWITHRHFEAKVLAHRVIHLENQTLRPLQIDELADTHIFTT